MGKPRKGEAAPSLRSGLQLSCSPSKLEEICAHLHGCDETGHRIINTYPKNSAVLAIYSVKQWSCNWEIQAKLKS